MDPLAAVAEDRRARAVPTLRDRPARKVTVTDDPTAALLVRVWFEGATDQFRARVTSVGLQSAEEDHTIALASSLEGVLEAVRRWLDDFSRRGTTAD
jgi:hypothetical protein